MCQNPNPIFGARPNGLHSPGRSKEEREAKRQLQVQQFSSLLANGDASVRVQAARDIRRIVRESPRGRSAFAIPAIIQPLNLMLRSVDHASKESALLALLNMAVRNEQNKEKIISSGTVCHIVEILSSVSSLREAATAAILTLSSSSSNKSTIAASGAIPLLVKILASGSTQGRVDAVTVLYNLAGYLNSDAFSVEAAGPLLSLLRDSKKNSKFADKATALIAILSESEEGRQAISEARGGILTIVETVESGSHFSMENAASILLSLCQSNRNRLRELILNEGPIPGLLLLTVEGTKKACKQACDLLELLRCDSQSKRDVSENLETVVYSIAERVDGPKKAEETTKKFLQDMNRRNIEESIKKL